MQKERKREVSANCQLAFKNEGIPQYGPSDKMRIRGEEEMMRNSEADSREP